MPIFNIFPKHQKLKDRWKAFHQEFSYDLTDFEKKNAIPTFQKEMRDQVNLLEQESIFKTCLSETEWKYTNDFINNLKSVYCNEQESTPGNLLDLERYIEKMQEHGFQIKSILDNIFARINPNGLSEREGSHLLSIQALNARIQRNINAWYKHRSELNAKIFSILLEERKIAYANRLLCLEAGAVIIGIGIALSLKIL